MWTTPKTNWLSTDYFNYSDYNRIKNNIAYIKELSTEMFPDFQSEEMGNDKTSYAEYPYADEFNALENNLELLRNNTFPFDNSGAKQWYENQRTPNYEDFNRIENACLLFYNGLTSQKNALRRFPFRLGTKSSAIRI